MLPAGFEPAIPVDDRPQTHALDRSATGIGLITPYECYITFIYSSYILESFKQNFNY